jgi:NAD-dependent dihydropyrimidine dehydrogenase PreA subunit
MDWDYLIQHTLLRLAFLVLILGVTLRIVFFFFAVSKCSLHAKYGLRTLLSNLGRAVVPLHMVFSKKTLYAIMRYVFHICVIVVPIWYSGHIYLWEEYGFDWYWTPLPDVWSDRLTIAVLAFAGYFFVRRIIVLKIQHTSSISDFFIVIITVLPFLTGYVFTSGTMNSIPFFDNHLQNIHILTAEVMMVMVAFLFCRIQLSTAQCTGCASCESGCPTQALTTIEKGHRRIFNYALYQCICCGACMYTCPEGAAELRHEISLKRFFQISAKPEIRSVELAACEKCGALFAPEPQVAKLNLMIADNYIQICRKCKQRDNARKVLMKS